MKKLSELFFCFFKIGLFTFGGGYAMIALIQREVSEKKKWISNKDILDITSICESTPGPISINTATFVGYKVSGFLGALVSTLGVIIPSFLIVSLISMFMSYFTNNIYIEYAFYGIRSCVLALILKSLILMYKECPHNISSYIVILFSFLIIMLFDINVIFVIILCGLYGIISSLIIRRFYAS